MLIGIPSMGNRGLNETVGEHFGRVPFYTIINTESDEIRVIPNSSEHMGGSGYPAELLSNEGVEAMICGGIGRRAISIFDDKGIRVYAGARGTIAETVEAFRSGKLSECGESGACEQHAFRGQGKRHDNCEGHHHHG